MHQDSVFLPIVHSSVLSLQLEVAGTGAGVEVTGAGVEITGAGVKLQEPHVSGQSA